MLGVGGVVEVGAQQHHRVGVGPVGGARDWWCAVETGDVVRRIEGRVDDAAPRQRGFGDWGELEVEGTLVVSELKVL